MIASLPTLARPSLRPERARSRTRTFGRLAMGAVLSVASVVVLRGVRLSDARDVLSRSSLWWLGAAVVAATLTTVASGVSLLAVTPRPGDVRSSVAAQFAATFASRLAPGGVGGVAVRFRFLIRNGLDRSSAAAGLATMAAAGLIVRSLAFAAISPWLPTGVAGVPHRRFLVGGAVVVLGGIGGLGFVVRHHRSTAAPSVPVRQRRVGLLFSGSIGVVAGHVAALWCCVAALHIAVSPTVVVAAYLASAAVGALSPLPGGLGALEIALAAGLSAGGVGRPEALACVVLYRTVSFWLPVLPGALSFWSLRRRAFL